MKNQILNLTLVLILLVGLGLLLYPSFSDYWNSFRQSQVIAHYAEDINSIQDEQYEVLLQEAREWNADHANKSLSQGELEAYDRLLDPLGTGMMGYIEIPAIDCFLAIYHGTSDAVLQIATGHIEWSSLPVGGEGTHSVISGHRGLPSAKLFSDLDGLVIGDMFDVFVLNETYRYEVDQINVVLPTDMSDLEIFPGEDYMTLVTCTPYGINTHRLLVRGKRVETVIDRTLPFTSEAVQINSVVVAAVLSIPILLFLIFWVFLRGGRSAARDRERIKRNALEKIRANRSILSEEPSKTKDARSSTEKRKKADRDG